MATSKRYSVSIVVFVFMLAAPYAAASAMKPTRSPMTLNYARAGHTATALSDDRVLVVGGTGGRGSVKVAEIYDAKTALFNVTGSLIQGRTRHTATAMADSSVLVIGGENAGIALDSSEVFDAATEVFQYGPRLSRPRAGHTATALADGRIVVVGGDSEGTIEIFNGREFELISATLAAPRAEHSAIVLQDGRVLIAGGESVDGTPLRSAEIFDPSSRTVSLLGSQMHAPRLHPDLRMLPDGKVQVIGGDEEATMEMFNAEGQYFTAYAHLLNGSTPVEQLLRSPARSMALGMADGSEREALIPRGEALARSEYSLIDMPRLKVALIAGGRNAKGLALRSIAMLSSSTATVTTDKTDYSPGETVVITGTGWQPGETVSLNIHRDTNDPPDTLLTAVADASGNIQNSDYVVQETDLGLSFLLTATGQSSGYTAQTTFTDSGAMGYSPSDQSLTATAGGSAVSFTQTVTAPKNNGSFTASLQVAGTGANPIPAAWVSTSPATLSFVTTPSVGDTKSWDVSFLVPAGTTAGIYTADIKANPSITGVGVGPGTHVTLTLSCSAPTITTCAPAQQASANASCQAAVPDFAATTVVSSLGCTATVTQSPAAGTLVGLGPHTITITATNASGTATCQTTFTVNDTTPPTITVNGANPATVECHTSYSDAGATANDACAGSVPVTPSGSVDPNTVGTYTITYTASDPSGNTQTATRTVNVVDTTKPVITINGANPATVECHTSYADAGATANDSCAGPVAVAPSGSVDPNTVGSYTITYTASDPSGNTQTATRTVNVVDTTKPVITINGANPATVYCHTSYTDAGAVATDSCAGLVSVTSSSNVNVNTVGTYYVTYTASDPSGNVQTATRIVNVINTAPAITSVTGPPGPLAIGSSASVTAYFTDPDPGQAHTCTFTWDDPSNPTSSVSVAAGVFSCTGTHTYNSASVNTVSVVVSDYCADDSGIFQFVVVYDPNAGFVTGGGFINSPAGAYVADPSLTGRANFGFVSKYHRGATIPTGNTEFQFQTASFNFHSTVYQWLVIAGPKAQYKGTGTVNGAGNFGFLLTATDGQVNGGGGVDKFRIKIWDNDNAGAIVYDNVLGTSDDIDGANPQAIAGGSIVIHSN